MKPLFYLPFLLLLFLPEIILSQIPDTSWTRTYGGTNIDVAHYVQQTIDGGYIITGYTRSYGTLSGRNVWLFKTDSAGVMQWNNTYGGNEDDEGHSVQQTADGGYIISGWTKSSSAGGMDVILVKTDSLGNETWKKTFGGTSDDEGYSVLQTNDGGYIIGGVTSSFAMGGRDVWVIRADVSGNEIWRKNYGSISSDGAWSIRKTFDGGFILTGWTMAGDVYGNALLVKIDSSGNQVWQKAFGGADADRGLSVKQTADSGFIITGYTESIGAGLADAYLIKTNASGTEEWSKTFGGSGRDYGNSVYQTADGGYIITGSTLSFGGGENLWVIKTNSSGIEEWNKLFGGTATDVGKSIQQTSDGGFIIAGYTLSYGAGVHDAWLIKIAPVVPVELVSFSGSAEGKSILLSWITASEINNKGFVVERKSTGNSWEEIAFIEGAGTTTKKQEYSFTDSGVLPGIYNYRLKQIDFNGSFEYSGIVEISLYLPDEFVMEQNYPNPFNPFTKIRYQIPVQSQVIIKLYDVLGNEIETMLNENVSAGVFEITWNAKSISGGVYFCKLTAVPVEKAVTMFTETKKLVLLK